MYSHVLYFQECYDDIYSSVGLYIVVLQAVE